MQTALDCYPCFFRQALKAAKLITDDPMVHQQILRQVSLRCAELNLRDRNIYFLLIHKCALVANHHNSPQGSFVVRSALENKP
jgi:uncharacterized protein with ATP-grasp and redox domains